MGRAGSHAYVRNRVCAGAQGTESDEVDIHQHEFTVGGEANAMSSNQEDGLKKGVNKKANGVSSDKDKGEANGRSSNHEDGWF